MIDFIWESAGITVLQELPADLSKISYIFEEEDDALLDESEFFWKFPFLKEVDFTWLNPENVGENPLLEIMKTYYFLSNRFERAKEKFEKRNFDMDTVLTALIRMLASQVIEAWKGKRKLKNGTVVGLSQFSEHQYTFMKVPYYAFACTNVSLDTVKIQDRNGKEFSLRQIDDLMEWKNDIWGVFLPNSMGVSASLMTTNEKWEMVFIAQERNNATTLTQNKSRYIASASGAVDYSVFSLWTGLDILHDAVGAEVEEELWVNPIRSQLTKETIHARTKWWVEGILEGRSEYQKIHALWDILNQEWMQILGRELWLDANLLPAALVMEEKRRNPEFIFLWRAGYSIEEIRKFWEHAESKDESLSIRWITFQDIVTELERRKNWWENMIDNHFFMSYIGFLIKGK